MNSNNVDLHLPGLLKGGMLSVLNMWQAKGRQEYFTLERYPEVAAGQLKNIKYPLGWYNKQKHSFVKKKKKHTEYHIVVLLSFK